ncbi:NAD(P)/FAD-dependent oxidoreductase [Neobacillus sp. LXY-1]|uniref:NAD(P)/FAD-dependent oxidoreductase n=1 Tax=Neobacillus sp. LXY-1 TaxID=3379133 RepID=UPI003EE207D4
MENLKTIVVVGGGYAGINLIEALTKEFQRGVEENIRIILIDKNAFHFKKVKLFKGIVHEHTSDLHVPLKDFCKSDIEFIQGEVTAINPEKQTIQITRKDGAFIQQEYDKLVLAMGSVMSEVDPERGGIALSSLANAKSIRQELVSKFESSTNPFRIAIVGSGITGIETAAELNSWLKNEIVKGNKSIEIYLINNNPRLLPEAPVKISVRLEARLKRHGIHVLHHKKVEKFLDHKVFFSDQTECEVDYCIWTVGLKPHPCIQELGLPQTQEGKIKVDSWYCVEGVKNIYAIGDCVHVSDPISEKVSTMTCKEAVAQAQRLAKIMKAHMMGCSAIMHQTYPEVLCIGLGPKDGFVWAHKWGVDFVLTGKIAEKIREYTWNLASLHY